MQVYLASTSPRRKQILENLGVKPIVVPVSFEEAIPERHADPPSLAREFAKAKLENADCAGRTDGLLVTADTLVFLGERVFGKPRDREDAARMLRELSGRTHRVVTGICLRRLDTSQTSVFSVESEVCFDEISPRLLEGYLSCGDWSDKAGAYGIQGFASLFVREVRGCYFNVVGFPVNAFFREVWAMGASIGSLRF